MSDAAFFYVCVTQRCVLFGAFADGDGMARFCRWLPNKFEEGVNSFNQMAPVEIMDPSCSNAN